jgi:hypothetical protein
MAVAHRGTCHFPWWAQDQEVRTSPALLGDPPGPLLSRLGRLAQGLCQLLGLLIGALRHCLAFTAAVGVGDSLPAAACSGSRQEVQIPVWSS